jgi:hypothetical protein
MFTSIRLVLFTGGVAGLATLVALAAPAPTIPQGVEKTTTLTKDSFDPIQTVTAGQNIIANEPTLLQFKVTIGGTAQVLWKAMLSPEPDDPAVSGAPPPAVAQVIEKAIPGITHKDVILKVLEGFAYVVYDHQVAAQWETQVVGLPQPRLTRPVMDGEHATVASDGTIAVLAQRTTTDYIAFLKGKTLRVTAVVGGAQKTMPSTAGFHTFTTVNNLGTVPDPTNIPGDDTFIAYAIGLAMYGGLEWP